MQDLNLVYLGEDANLIQKLLLRFLLRNIRKLRKFWENFWSVLSNYKKSNLNLFFTLVNT